MEMQVVFEAKTGPAAPVQEIPSHPDAIHIQDQAQDLYMSYGQTARAMSPTPFALPEGDEAHQDFALRHSKVRDGPSDQAEQLDHDGEPQDTLVAAKSPTLRRRSCKIMVCSLVYCILVGVAIAVGLSLSSLAEQHPTGGPGEVPILASTGPRGGEEAEGRTLVAAPSIVVAAEEKIRPPPADSTEPEKQ